MCSKEAWPIDFAVCAKEKSIRSYVCVHIVYICFFYSISLIHRLKTFSDWLYIGVCVSLTIQIHFNPTHWLNFLFFPLWRWMRVYLRAGILFSPIHVAFCMFGCVIPFKWLISGVELTSYPMCVCLFSELTVLTTFFP